MPTRHSDHQKCPHTISKCPWVWGGLKGRLRFLVENLWDRESKRKQNPVILSAPREELGFGLWGLVFKLSFGFTACSVLFACPSPSLLFGRNKMMFEHTCLWSLHPGCCGAVWSTCTHVRQWPCACSSTLSVWSFYLCCSSCYKSLLSLQSLLPFFLIDVLILLSINKSYCILF